MFQRVARARPLLGRYFCHFAARPAIRRFETEAMSSGICGERLRRGEAREHYCGKMAIVESSRDVEKNPRFYFGHNLITIRRNSAEKGDPTSGHAGFLAVIQVDVGAPGQLRDPTRCPAPRKTRRSTLTARVFPGAMSALSLLPLSSSAGQQSRDSSAAHHESEEIKQAQRCQRHQSLCPDLLGKICRGKNQRQHQKGETDMPPGPPSSRLTASHDPHPRTHESQHHPG